MFTNKQSNLDNEEIFYDQLWNYLQLSEGQEIYSSKSDVFLGSFSLEENQIWVQINGPDEYHYSYCKNREDLESIVNDFLGEGGSIADIISVIGKKNSDVIIEFNNLSLEHFIDYGIHGEIKESPDDNKIYDQFIDGITYAPKFDQIIDEKLIKIEDAIINFEWINAFKKWQIELVEKTIKNKYMIGSTIFFREKVNSYLDLIKPFALNEIIYFLVAQVGDSFIFLPDTNRKLEKSMKGVKYYWISEHDFLNLLTNTEKCISLLANQSVLTIRFLSNDSCIKDDTFLSLSSELSSDIEAYQYLDYGQYLWMGYENGEYDTGLIHWDHDQEQVFNPYRDKDLSIYSIQIP